LDPQEAELVARLASGEPGALDDALRVHWSSVALFAQRALGDRDAAEDVSQETFIRLWESRERLSGGSLRAFLFRLARNLVIDELRKRAVRARFTEAKVGVAAGAASPAAVFEANEAHAAIERALNSLPARRREAFVLAYLHDLSYREVAETLGVSHATVKNHVAAALADLRSLLQSA
jgi:RNA polymerase sigma-70 factor (ECF subfamily)